MNNDDTIKPFMIVACGQRQILTKTGNRFPAFLVKLSIPNDEASLSRSTTNSKVYAWKSKRDFMWIARISKEYGISYPKAALAKLGACFPWVRPNPIQEDMSLLDKMLNSSGDDNQNHYCRKMKKSLNQLDSFFNQIHQKQLEFQYSGKEGSLLVKAWSEFCNENLPENLISVDDEDIQSKDTNGSLAEDEATKRGTLLGQYFASVENVQHIVDTSFDILSKSLRLDIHNCIFVEPSCGDGRILVEIFRRQKKAGVSKPRVIGYDIDPSACEACSSRLESEGVDAPIVCADFLRLTKSQLLNDLPHTIRGVDQEKISIIVVGGPPYTIGRGKDIQRDLPMNFIVHSKKELNAEMIAFILPVRCKKEEFIEDALLKIEGLKHHLNKKARVESANSQNDVSPTRIRCLTFALRNSKFYFRGITHKAVDQPSILQTWFKPNNSVRKV